MPAGTYSREYLERKRLWQTIHLKVIPTENVHGALAAVEAGNAYTGMVYKTDACFFSRSLKSSESGPPPNKRIAMTTSV